LWCYRYSPNFASTGARQLEIPLSVNIDAAELYEKVTNAHVQVIKNLFIDISDNSLKLRKQNNASATYWEGRQPKDGEIDLAGSVITAERLVRATTSPYPGAFTIKDGRKIIIWKANIIKTIKDGLSSLILSFEDGYLDCIKIEYTD